MVFYVGLLLLDVILPSHCGRRNHLLPTFPSSCVEETQALLACRLLLTSVLKDAFCKFQDDFLSTFLDGIVQRAQNMKSYKNEVDVLQSILVKLINNFDRLEDLLSLVTSFLKIPLPDNYYLPLDTSLS